MENGKYTVSKKNSCSSQNLLSEACKELTINLTEQQVFNFSFYMEQLIETNKVLNLTSITEPSEIVIKHFIDSLTLVDLLPKGEFKCIDVGTGAGFPSLPIKLVLDEMQLTLLDSVAKKLNFVDGIIAKLELKNVSTLHARAEDTAKTPKHREAYDVCVTRAVARMNILTEYCLPFVKPGGVFYAMKGKELTEELDEAKKAITLLGGEIRQVKTCRLPFSDIEHTIVSIDKKQQTPYNYPRKAAIVSKKPIKD